MNSKNQDYLNFKASSHLINNETIVLSCMVTKYNEAGFRQERVLILTENAIYNIKKSKVKRRIPYEKLDAMTISTTSSEFLIHVNEEYDYRYLSYERRSEIIETILYILCNVRNLCTAFRMYEVELINLNSVMTTQANFKDRKKIRPPDSQMKIMNLESYKVKEKEDTKRATDMRKRTTVLYSNIKNDKKDICLEDFELLKVLGKGAFGKVVLAQKKENKKYYAIKILIKKKIIEMDQMEHTKAEKMILQHINHPFLVGLEYAFQTDERIYFVLQFMQGGELFQHLRKQKRFPESQAKFYAACIALGIGHLHNKNYIYRDLKLENLLLDDKGYAVLTDFGLAKFIGSSDKALTFCGTPEYLAPEVILGKGHNRPADWWAFGILIYEMIFGIPPFYSSNVQNMYKKAVKESVAFKQGIEVSPECKDLIQKLLDKEQKTRFGSTSDSLEILSHDWFKDIDLSKLLEKKLKSPFQPDLLNWEKNFDDEFIKERIRESEAKPNQGKVDLEILEKFKQDFNDMNFNRENEPVRE
jgi:serum/glucocorticoid-regulated kinase 2